MESEESSTQQTEPLPGKKPRDRSYLPSVRVLVFLGLCIVGIVVVRQLEIDLAIVNIVTAIFTILALACLLAWWCFQSAFSPAVRWFPPALLVVAAAVIPIRYQFVKLDGSLIPELVKRGEALPDERLPPIEVNADAQVIDLTVTSKDDFPRFLGPTGDSRVAHVELDRDWVANPPERLWVREIGAGWSSFAAVNGYAITMEQRGDDELVSCYEALTGVPRWSHTYPTRHSTIFGYVGPRCTPTIANGRVYVMGATGIVRCLSSEGELIWLRDLFADHGMNQEQAEKAVAWGRANSPLVIDGQVILPIGGPRDGANVSLVSLDAETGETRWEGGNRQASYATAELFDLEGGRQIVSVNENFVSGHDPNTGEVLWEHPWEGRSDMNANVSQPHRIDANRLFLSKGYGKGAELIELESIGNGEFTTRVVWENRVMKTKFSNVAIYEGFAYGLDDGILSCVDVETGERMWKKGRYRYGQILLVGDSLLVLAEDGRLALVNATPDGFDEIDSVQALEGQSWNNLCLYGEYLLLRNAEQAACYRLKLRE